MTETSGFALSSTLGLTLVVVFGLAWVLFGWYLGRANKTHEDFALVSPERRLCVSLSNSDGDLGYQ